MLGGFIHWGWLCRGPIGEAPNLRSKPTKIRSSQIMSSHHVTRSFTITHRHNRHQFNQQIMARSQLGRRERTIFGLALCCSLSAVDASSCSSWQSTPKPFPACHQIRAVKSTPKFDTLVPLSIRGGSESASAWNAGSKYEYRTPPKSSPTYSRSQSTQQQQSSVTGDSDTQDQTKEAIATAFLNREDRNRFIGKIHCCVEDIFQLLYLTILLSLHLPMTIARVYALLSGQLLFTAGTIQAFHMNPNIRNWMLYTNAGRKVPLLSLMVSSIALFLTMSSDSTRQSSSMRWPLFILFTIGQAVPVGFISSLFAYGTVIKAMTTTATATLAITLYTVLQKNPKYDLSQWGRTLSGLGLAFVLYGFVHLLELFGVLPYGFLPYSEAIYCVLGAGLFSLYLAHHTRLIVAGKSAKYQMNEKDYILGAMTLYSDILDIFLYILRLLGEMEDRE